MKKTLLVTLDFPPNRGGVATYYQHLAAELPVDHFFVLAPTQEGDAAFDRSVNYTIIREPLLRSFPQTWPSGISGVLKLVRTIRWLLLVRTVRRVCKMYNIEVILAGQVLPIGTVAWLYHKLTQMPYIIIAHGMDLTVPQYYLRKKRLLKKIIVGASYYIANSIFTSTELKKLGADHDDITVITPCPNQYSATNQYIDSSLQNKKIILGVGRLVERKGHDMVIAALPEVLKIHPDVCYVIIGDGPRKEFLQKKVAELQLTNSVFFTGQVTDDVVAAYYTAAEFVIMPSRQLANGDVEGFGIIYLEANAFGKPVIGGQSGGVSEAIVNGQTGLLVDPLSITEISQAITKLLNDPELARRLGEQGKQRVEKDFTWPTRGEQLLHILQ